MRGVVVVRHVHPVAVVGGLAPIGGRCAAQQRRQAAALHEVGGFDAGESQQRRRKVGVVDQRPRPRAGRGRRRVAHEQRDAQRFLVHPALVDVVVLAEHEALVGGVNDDRIIEFAFVREVLEQPRHAVIDAAHGAQVFLQIALVGRALVGAGGERGIDEHMMPHVAAGVALADRRAHALGRRRAVVGGLPQAGRFGDVGVCVEEIVALGVLEIIVRRLEMVHQEKRFRAVAALEPVERNLGDDVGRVGGIVGGKAPRVARPRPAGFAHDGVEVRPLAGQDAVVIERGGFLLEVPFADHGRLVTGLADQPGQVLAGGFETSAERGHAVDVAVLSGEQRGPAGRADRIGAEGVLEDHALRGEAVERGRGVERGQASAVGSERVRGMVVGHDEQDVGLVGGGQGGTRGKETERGEEQAFHGISVALGRRSARPRRERVESKRCLPLPRLLP